MEKRDSSVITVQESLKIANSLLEVFKAFNSDVPCYLMSYPTKNTQIDKELENREEYVTFEWRDTSKIRTRMHEITSEDDLYKNNTYELYYKGHKYIMNLYESPEICGYVAGPKYDLERHIFCIITLVNIHNLAVKELDFTFDVESMKFLELFKINRTINKVFLDKNTGKLNWKADVVKYPKSYIKLEKKLQGQVLGKVKNELK